MLGLAIANLNIFYLTKNHNPPLQVAIKTCKGGVLSYSTVTDFAKFLGLSTSRPLAREV